MSRKQQTWYSRNKVRAAYKNHKNHAAYRGIEFLLTYEEWLKIWEDSGHIHERGLYKHQYCMARFNDKGPYAVGNVKIITRAENLAEQVHTEARNKKISVAMLGRKQTAEHVKNRAATRVGTKHSAEARQRMSAAQRRRQQREREHRRLIK